MAQFIYSLLPSVLMKNQPFSIKNIDEAFI